MKYAIILVSLLASANGYTQTQTETMTTETKRPSIKRILLFITPVVQDLLIKDIYIKKKLPTIL